MLIRESAIAQIRDKLTTVPTTVRKTATTETTRKATATDHDLDPLTRLHVLEAEARAMTTFTQKPAEELAGIPTRVLEAELKRRREANTEEVSEADLNEMSAHTFGRSTGEAKTTKAEISEADLDRASAQAFGREIKETSE
jgi:hypothetical protein